MRLRFVLMLLLIPLLQRPSSSSVVWTEDLGLSSLTDIDQRMRAPEDISAPLTLSPRFGVEGASRQVANCVDYLKATSDGLIAATTFAANLQYPFILHCFLLRDLKSAKPAVASFVPHEWPQESLNILPPLLQWYPERRSDKPKLEWASESGATVTNVKGDLLEVDDQFSEFHLHIVGRGDFNGDGFEDLAVVGEVQVKSGSYFGASYYLLTRCGPSGVLRRVRVDGFNEQFEPARCP
jgi:hypothetical protein